MTVKSPQHRQTKLSVLQVNKRLHTSLSVVVWNSDSDCECCSNFEKDFKVWCCVLLKILSFLNSVAKSIIFVHFSICKKFCWTDFRWEFYLFYALPKNSAYFLPKIQTFSTYLKFSLNSCFDHFWKQKRNGFFLFSVGPDEFEYRNSL